MTQMNDEKKNFEPEVAVTASAIPVDGGYPQQAAANIAVGHARFYCEKCQSPYDLPDRATSWRCTTCSTFNSITPGECEWCSIL